MWHVSVKYSVKPHLYIQHHARPELCPQRQRLLSDLQQPCASRMSAQAPVLRQPCQKAVGSPLLSLYGMCAPPCVHLPSRGEPCIFKWCCQHSAAK